MLTVIAPLGGGDHIEVGGVDVTVENALAIGHKVAAEPIPAGARIVKYGAPIGSATRDIAVGEHVHTQNVRSDYLPTYLREDQAKYFAAARADRTTGGPPITRHGTGEPPVVPAAP